MDLNLVLISRDCSLHSCHDNIITGMACIDPYPKYKLYDIYNTKRLRQL